MTRIEAMTAFSALDTPALYAEMQRRGIASPDFDAACKWAEKVCDRIAKTSAATLATMTDWRQILERQRQAAALRRRSPRRYRRRVV